MSRQRLRSATPIAYLLFFPSESEILIARTTMAPTWIYRYIRKEKKRTSYLYHKIPHTHAQPARKSSLTPSTQRNDRNRTVPIHIYMDDSNAAKNRRTLPPPDETPPPLKMQTSSQLHLHHHYQITHNNCVQTAQHSCPSSTRPKAPSPESRDSQAVYTQQVAASSHQQPWPTSPPYPHTAAQRRTG